MKVSIGYSDSPDSILAGRLAAQMALSKVNGVGICDIVLLFHTARHNSELLRKSVSEVTGNTNCIYGGGAVGIITNDIFGYAGDQVGVACFWLEGSSCNILSEVNLTNNNEIEVGESLGNKLKKFNITKNTPVMLMYNAVYRSGGDMHLLMATRLLDGIEKSLGFLPDLVGAGMQGDHVCSSTKQYFGKIIENSGVFALSFSDDICMHSIIMHGCRPSSPYYTVTKVDGPVILEINNQPALSFIDKVIDSSISIDEYPFFLLLGINYGDRWSEYNEDNYASRLCLGVDKKRDGLIMFEPDMVEGTEFQLMTRSLGLDYMQPRIDELFSRIEDEEPIFAMYIDCAGRCAGYGGLDIEDAKVIQNAIKDRMPLFGLYTGVEIATMGGKPRGLDWTGVLCIFTKNSIVNNRPKSIEAKESNIKSKFSSNEKVSEEGLMRLCEQATAKVYELDTQTIAIRHELEQKRRGFALLAELAVSLQQGSDESVFFLTTKRLNATLNMQKTVVLFPSNDDIFIPGILQGFTEEEKIELVDIKFNLSQELLDSKKTVIITAIDDKNKLKELRETLGLPYFISTPIVVQNEIVALLITGRLVEQPPFLSRLNINDAETIKAICALLSSILVHHHFDEINKRAKIDALTGLLNRGEFEKQVKYYLNKGIQQEKLFALIIIDLDYFKQINDNYGHIVGDIALKKLGETLHKSFRNTDLVARLGGDEFIILCEITRNIEQIENKVTNLMLEWNKTSVVLNSGAELYTTLSIGIAISLRDGVEFNELFHKADVALYQSKRNGRNRHTLYNDKFVEKYIEF